MNSSKKLIISNSLIWFGAGISIAEILTGTLIAPLGFTKGLFSIILGHLIGSLLLFLSGFIGGKTKKSSMETVKLSFGNNGAVFFSLLNILQLAGWTAIMIESGTSAAQTVINIGSTWFWSALIGILIIIWILIGVKNLDKVNYITMGGLFILTIVMSSIIFRQRGVFVGEQDISFGAAVELSVAMPLSWLPLISDYTRNSKKPFLETMSSTIAYFFASCWMYVIGMGATLFTGENDIALIMTKTGLGIGAVIIIIFSTVTTTFLDVYSAGVSAESIFKKLKERPFAIAICILGVILAVFTPITKLEDFLYIISSVFAPMVAIQITDYFILKKDSSNQRVNLKNFLVWFIGFIIYRLLMHTDTVVGYTLPAMIIICVISIIADKITSGRQ